MKTYKYITFITLWLGTFLSAFAQVEMADTMRSNGKIYVVVAVVVTIFLGFIAYLVTTDKKVSQLEKDIQSIQED